MSRAELTWVDKKGTWRVRVEPDGTWILQRYHPEEERWSQIGYFHTRQAAIDYSKEES